MATAEEVKAKLQGQIDKINATTGGTDTTLADAVDTVIAGFGQGGDRTVAMGILDGTLTEYRNEELTHLRDSAFYGHAELTRAILPKLFSINSSSLRSCPKLEIIDAFAHAIQANSIRDSSSLKTIILRVPYAVSALIHLNAFQGTPFYHIGGTGGTAYVPAALIESYKTATNWVTLYEAGTCNFVAIEGSEYE